MAILVFYQEKSSQINKDGLFNKAIKMYGSLLVYGTEREYAGSLWQKRLGRYMPGKQEYKVEDSSSARCRIESASGPFESAGRDESSEIRLEVVACL